MCKQFVYRYTNILIRKISKTQIMTFLYRKPRRFKLRENWLKTGLICP